MIGIPTSFVSEQPHYTKHVMSPVIGRFLYGYFGVGIFFLISGLVIPIGLRNISTIKFLIRRFFRIYPVYWFCMLVSIAMYLICSWYWSAPLSSRISLPFIADALPLLHSAEGIASLDFVCWSLAVEVKFYAIFSLVFLLGKNAHQVILLSIALLGSCCLATYFSLHHLNQDAFFPHLISDMKYMTFMFIGCLFYYLLYREISLGAMLGYGAIIYALFVTTNSFYEKEVFTAMAQNYTYALALFSACYLFRNKFKDNKVLDFLADISFPLYLVHSMIGYVTMTVLIDKGIPFTLAWMISLSLAILIAFGVHRYIEVPVNDFGKKLSDFRSKVVDVNMIS